MKACRLIAAFLLTGALAACDNAIPEWSTAALEYRCTEQEMRRVKSESDWCTENTNYLGNFCFGSAMIRNCSKPEGADCNAQQSQHKPASGAVVPKD